ncbi:MAG: spore coat associated protein CotJA [Clostridia bacterium]
MYKIKTAKYCDLADTLVPAGSANEGLCANDIAGGNIVALARIDFPEQSYLYTFCPDKALQCGTIFPELVNAG